MSKQRFIKRYSLIVNFIRRTPSSFETIKNYLQQQSLLEEENFEVAIRTFQRDLKEIESLFGIKIRNNRARGVYEIIDNADETEDKYNRLMESFDVFNALHLSNQFNQLIIVEKRKPLGLQHMYVLLHAIKNNYEVQFYHEKYWCEDENKYLKTIQPLSLKEARFRWYIIGFDTADKTIKQFGLDRISELKILESKFENINNYDLEGFFKHSFGIITNQVEEPYKVVLSFTYNQGKYIKSFPLHHSQQVIIDDKEEFRIELLIHPTYDFVMELLSIGEHVKVLEPTSLQNEIINRLRKSLIMYE